MELIVNAKRELGWSNEVVGFARYEADKWELRSLFNIYTVWRPKSWKEGGEDYLPTTPAERPFELKDLSGDGIPEVIVAGEVDKYYQEHYLLRWNAKKKILTFVAEAMSKPELIGDYVRLYFNSGRRAIWGRWEFCQWEGDRLVERASWHEEVWYNENDETFTLATRMNNSGEKTEFKLKDAGSASEKDSVYAITRQDKPFAQVTFKWPRSLVAVTGDGYYPSGEESAYLFEKLTGLSRKLYPGLQETRRVKSLEKSVEFNVEGGPDAVQMLSPRR